MTANGELVILRHRRTSLRRSSGVGCVSAVSWEDIRKWGEEGKKMDVLFLGLRRWRLRRRAQRSQPWSGVRGIEQYVTREQTIAFLLALQGLLTVSNCEGNRVAEVLYS